jgi:hypothetical protein
MSRGLEWSMRRRYGVTRVGQSLCQAITNLRCPGRLCQGRVDAGSGGVHVGCPCVMSYSRMRVCILAATVRK